MFLRFLQRLDRSDLALPDFSGVAGAGGDGFAQTLDFRVKFGGVVRPGFDNGELLAGFGKLVFQSEIAVFLCLVALVGAAVEVFDGVLGLFQIRFESGNALALVFGSLAGGLKRGVGFFQLGGGNGMCFESFEFRFQGFLRFLGFFESGFEVFRAILGGG